MQGTHSVVMIGATGAVGSNTALALASMPEIERLTLLGRRPLTSVTGSKVQQHQVDVLDPATYAAHIAGHDVAICTLGVGQPSKVSRDEFLRIDKLAVLDFAKACKTAGVSHFQLLSSVGADAKSSSFYLRSKGELEEALAALGFPRLSVFRPSMILTPTNRYGVAQAITLKTWPVLSCAMFGPLKKLRGIKVEDLGQAIANNLGPGDKAVETLYWTDFHARTSHAAQTSSAS